MNALKVALSVLLTAVITLVAGCSKQEETPSTPAASKEAVAPAEAQKPADSVAASADAEASSLIDKAKSLIADQKYTEALDTLKKLSSMKLTPEQQKLVDDLKAQVQKAITSGAAADAQKKATDAAGGMLK